MTTYLGKSCSFCLPRVPFVNCRQFMYLVISLLIFEGRIWDLIVSVPDHCLSFYFVPYPVKGLLEVYEDVVEILLMLHVFLAEDPEIEYLFCGDPSGSETSV